MLVNLHLSITYVVTYYYSSSCCQPLDSQSRRDLIHCSSIFVPNMENPLILPANHDLEYAQPMDRLSVFREGVGIADVRSLGANSSKRTAQNIGIYRRVVSAERNARIQYYASAALINSCLLLQIVFAASLTALGASNGSNIVITGVGAANTVIAGLLSFTKGQGLPNKLMQYQNALRKVREHIEHKEREFSQLECKLDLHEEIKTVVDMYASVRSNDEANDPNAYHQPLESTAKSQPAPDQAAKTTATSVPGQVEALLEKLAGHSKEAPRSAPADNAPGSAPKDVGNTLDYNFATDIYYRANIATERYWPKLLRKSYQANTTGEVGKLLFIESILL